MVARRPFLPRSPTLSSTIPGYAGDHKGPLHSSPPPSPLRIRVLRRRLPPKKPTRESPTHPLRPCPYYTTDRLPRPVYGRGGACPLKYRFFAGSASQAEGGNAISICSNGFPGGFTGNLSKKPILESGACPRPGGGTGVWLKFAPMGHGLRITYPQTGCSITKGRRALDARS